MVSFPVRLAVCGLLFAPSTTDRVADWALAVGGANWTEIVQLAPAARELPQLFDWVNPVFEIEMFVMFKVPD